MTIQQKRLILTAKASSPLGGVQLRPEIAQLVDPKPDFDLLDICQELQAIEAKLGSPEFRSLDGAPSAPPRTLKSTPTSNRFGGNVSDVADFGRRGFRMSLWDGGFDSDDDSDEDSEEEIVGPRPLAMRSGHEDDYVDKENQILTTPTKEDEDRENRSEWVLSPVLPPTDEGESALLELDRERLVRVQDEIKQTRQSFVDKFKEEQQAAAARFALLEREEAIRREKARRIDKQDQRTIAEARDQHLSVLLRDHEQRIQVEQRAIRKEVAAEEARKREDERIRKQHRKAREEAEAEAKRKADAERRKAEAEMAKRRAQADAAAAAAQQRAEADRKSKLEAEQKVKLEAEKKAKLAASQEASKAAFSVPKPRVAEQAAKLEEERLNKLKELRESYQQLAANPALKKDFKVYERQVIKHLQQISATQEQVRKKSADLIQLFRTPNGPPIQFLIVILGSKVLSQCESQVQKLPSFAFALAQVIVNVASQVPFVMESVLAQLHEVCIFTVPKYYPYNKAQYPSDEVYYKALGYKQEDGKLESTDDYVARLTAYMAFYGAVVQTEVVGGANPHGLREGWAWCSRLLNRIPANRLSASALEAFLKAAGYRLSQAYRKPFMKLLQTVVSEFLVNLKNHEDVDARAVVYRLETYLHTGAFNNPPEGRNMPLTDISSQMRA